MLHEFSSLAGVREDVTDMVLNVKQIALRMEGEGNKRLQLRGQLRATVSAKQPKRFNLSELFSRK